MTIDVVSRLEFLVELFEGRPRAPDDAAARQSGGSGDWRPASSATEPGAQTLTLAEMLAVAPTPLEAFSRDFRSTNEDTGKVVARIARFLADHVEETQQDAPGSPRVLAYVYPIV
jgi:hypothetical protein